MCWKKRCALWDWWPFANIWLCCQIFKFLFCFQIPCFVSTDPVLKLDGVGPVDDRPSTDKLHLLVRKKKKCDMWHLTRDTWHATCDTWHVTRLGVWTFSQNFSSLALTVCDLWYYEDLEEKADGLTQWMNHKAVYRTVPATPGLLIMLSNISKVFLFILLWHLPLPKISFGSLPGDSISVSVIASTLCYLQT